MSHGRHKRQVQTIGSLCTGYGGLDLAVQTELGGRLRWCADNDLYVRKIIISRFPGVPNLGDITRIEWAAVPKVDIITAGFPCQDISNAGPKTGIDGPRSGLWQHIAVGIGVLRPRLVFVENVACLRFRGLDRVLADLAALGYDASWLCLRASDIGAAHRRDRLFLLARIAADANGPR